MTTETTGGERLPSSADEGAQLGAEHEITRLLKGLHGRSSGLFRCTHVILYLPEAYGKGLLEPAFMVPEVKRTDRRPIERSGNLASYAFRGEEVYSLDPHSDIRLDGEARRIMDSYGIAGTIYACPLPRSSTSVHRTPLGVLVICAGDVLSPPDPTEQVRQVLGDAPERLTTLILLRERQLSELATRRYEELTQDVLRDLRTVRFPGQTTQGFLRDLRRHLSAEYALMHVTRAQHPQPECALSSSPLCHARATAELFAPVLGPNDALILNRKEHAPGLFCKLRTLHSRAMAWLAVGFRDSDARVLCAVAKRVATSFDHWTHHDATFLRLSASAFGYILQRSTDFDAMLEKLRDDQGTPERGGFGRQQFDFLCYICREFLGIDQVMLTEVIKEPTRYRVKGLFANGFGQKNSVIVANTDRSLSSGEVDADTRIDVMAYILRQYLRAERTGTMPKSLYSADVRRPPKEFTLDRENVKDCDLKGTISFLPCVTKADDGTVALRSILHLGSLDGTASLGQDVLPLLTQLASSVAGALANREREYVAGLLRNVYACTEPSPTALQTVVDSVAAMCRSIGCTLFLRASLAYLVGGAWRRLRQPDLQTVWVRFLSRAREWQRSRKGTYLIVREMLRAFLSAGPRQVSNLLAGGDTLVLGKLLAESLYVRVAQSVDGGLVAARGFPEVCFDADLDSPEFLDPFADFVARDCYLPGYGLTGWVLRYRKAMLLADKQAHTVDAYFRQVSPDVDASDRTAVTGVMRYNLARSGLARHPVIPPRHADHIRDHPSTSQRQDTYLAVPLQDIDDPSHAGGVLRTSTSVTLRSSFDRADEDAVMCVARHLSWLLQGAYMREQEFVQQQLDDRYFLDAIDHSLKHCVGYADVFQRHAAILPEEAQGAIEYLDKTEQKVSRYLARCTLVREVGTMADEPVALEELLSHLVDFSKSSFRMNTPVRFAVGPGSKCDRPCPKLKQCLVGVCVLVDEVVTNSCKHSKVRLGGIDVVVAGMPHLVVQISERDDGQDPVDVVPVNRHTLKPYRRLLRKPGGGGTRLLNQIASSTHLTCRYCTLKGGRRLYVVECQDCPKMTGSRP